MGSVNTILTVILVITGGLMTFLIMLQEGKGGGLAALGGTKAAGIEGVTNPIRRATGYMAALFFLLAIVLGVVNRPTASTIPTGGGDEETPTAATSNESGPSATVAAPAVVPAVPTINTVPANNATTPKTTTEKAPDGAKPDATKPDAQKAEPAKNEPGKTEAPKTDANKTEPAKTEPAKPAEQAKPDTKAPEQK
ncbi:MAG TPA: preprotein translocase subunit SecG [Planctomycetota bacterium]|nr:preprotein translocase subunit SecG [Planctomycetota bacterium]